MFASIRIHYGKLYYAPYQDLLEKADDCFRYWFEKGNHPKLLFHHFRTMRLYDKQCLQNACTKYFLAEFDYWDTTDDYPFCKIKGEYGTFGQVEIETQALLKTYSIEEPHYTE
jgi:exoribonuclease R